MVIRLDAPPAGMTKKEAQWIVDDRKHQAMFPSGCDRGSDKQSSEALVFGGMTIPLLNHRAAATNCGAFSGSSAIDKNSNVPRKCSLPTVVPVLGSLRDPRLFVPGRSSPCIARSGEIGSIGSSAACLPGVSQKDRPVCWRRQHFRARKPARLGTTTTSTSIPPLKRRHRVSWRYGTTTLPNATRRSSPVSGELAGVPHTNLRTAKFCKF